MSEPLKDKKHGRLYLSSFKQQIVREVEQEGNRSFVAERHGISNSTLGKWMRQYGTESYHQTKNSRRSLSEREGIARRIVSGHLSIEEAMLKGKTNCRETVTGWVRDYKKAQQELIEFSPQSEPLVQTDPIAVTAPAADLKLAELKIRALEIMLDIASKEFNVDIRKKFGAKQ